MFFKNTLFMGAAFNIRKCITNFTTGKLNNGVTKKFNLRWLSLRSLSFVEGSKPPYAMYLVISTSSMTVYIKLF